MSKSPGPGRSARIECGAFTPKGSLAADGDPLRFLLRGRALRQHDVEHAVLHRSADLAAVDLSRERDQRWKRPKNRSLKTTPSFSPFCSAWRSPLSVRTSSLSTISTSFSVRPGSSTGAG